jgi:hypothetical protein
MSGETNDDIRKLKRPYRKKAYQTGYSQKGEAMSSPPMPQHTYITETHDQTTPVRPGLDPRTYDRDVRPSAEGVDIARAINFANYPWHLVPKPESANLIQRRKYDFSAANFDLADDEYIDLIVLNASNVYGSDSWADEGQILGGADTGVFVPAPTAFTAGTAPPAPKLRSITQTGPIPSRASTSRFPTGSGSGAVAGIATGSTSTTVSQGDFYVVGSFGHSEAPTSTAGITYQIWVDNRLFLEWSDFQWSPVTPKTDQWKFDQPVLVAKQVVFRVVNRTGAGISTNTMEACFAGWSESKDAWVDIGRLGVERSNPVT